MSAVEKDIAVLKRRSLGRLDSSPSFAEGQDDGREKPDEDSGPGQSDLLRRFRGLRARTEALVAPLGPEDMTVQSMPDASPAKWHLAHSTWFFETFLLATAVPGYRLFDPAFGYLFNSYYEAIGPRHPRMARGMLTRPSVGDVMAYRHHVTRHMEDLLASALTPEVIALVRLGLAHEEQHQELILMDVLHLFSLSPLAPAYDGGWPDFERGRRGQFRPHPGGLFQLGDPGAEFAFDNESPRHTTFLQSFEIQDRLVTNGQWLEFMDDGGYRRADLWLSDGWAMVQAEAWDAPGYWRRDGGSWRQMTLAGLQAVDPDAPVVHLSYYEASAFAAWSGTRLPTEAEWEAAARAGLLEQADGVVWQWTQSAYLPYPGFRPAPSAVGEYNGKFMVNQMVLRGGASVTPPGHVRPSYRNFFLPRQRWMFSGLRLARDVSPAASAARLDATATEFSRDVTAGLALASKSIPPKYFYDADGSDLFEAICRTPEYYLTRTETTLLRQIAPRLSTSVPVGAALVEFGNGASTKTRVVLDSAPQIAAYVPIDISRDALEKSASELRTLYPRLVVAPLAGDFTRAVDLPAVTVGLPLMGFFPGSTLGNLTPTEAIQFLASARRLLGPAAGLILGVDLVKDPAVLLAAYDDAGGVTAAFNKNLLRRINRELDADFDLEQFDHKAIWNAALNRIEMHLASRREQQVRVAGQYFHFRAGETLHTENSHKFTIASVTAMATAGGWRLADHWISPEPQFAILRLEAAPGRGDAAPSRASRESAT